MSLKGKIYGTLAVGISTVVVLAVASAGGWLPGNGTRIFNQDRQVEVYGIWAPSPRLPHGVSLKLWVDGQPRRDLTQKITPYSYTFRTKAGTALDFRIGMLNADRLQAACMIKSDGVEIYTKALEMSKMKEELVCTTVVP